MDNGMTQDEGPVNLTVYDERESFVDCADQRREFDLRILELPNHGFAGYAHEVTEAEHGGYVFHSFSEGSQVMALARLRGAIRAGLAQRFLIDEGGGTGEMPLERLEGRIDREGLVVDGKLLDWQALLSLLSSYEGWEFELKIPFEPDR